jgi:hypothetical protein
MLTQSLSASIVVGIVQTEFPGVYSDAATKTDADDGNDGWGISL